MNIKKLLLLSALLLSGCELQSPDYYQIMVQCAQKKGYYFSVTIPTWIGPRLAAGCAQDFGQIDSAVLSEINRK